MNSLLPGKKPAPLAERGRGAAKTCAHCGTAFRTGEPSAQFCCGGCAFVHDLITQEGLDRYYDLKGSALTRPVENVAFELRDHAWLADLCGKAESLTTEAAVSLDLGLDGASCAGCVWLIERVFAHEHGGLRILTDPLQGQVEMTWEKGVFDATHFAERLQQYGYLLRPPITGAESRSPDSLLGRLGLCAAFALNGMAFALPGYLGMPADFMFAALFQLITALSATLSMAVGGSYFIRRAWQASREGVIQVDLPIALGIALAYVGSLTGWLLGLESMLYFDFVAIFIFLMLGGRWLQDEAMRRNRRRLFEDETVPKTVSVAGAPLPREELEPGMIYQVRPNQVIPVASCVLAESALLGMEWIQGESETREQSRGSVASSGAIYRGHRPAEMQARETWSQSLLFRLVQQQKPPANHPRLQRLLRVYLGLVLSVGIVGGLVWVVKTGELQPGLQVTLSIFVISCPCALGVAVPLADEMAAATARRWGVFVQELSFWGRLRRVRHVLFDKTGTLTLDTPQLLNPEALRSLDRESVQTLANIASTSSHPVSRSLAEHLAAVRNIRAQTPLESVDAVPGLGLRHTDCNNNVWTLSKPDHNRKADTEFRKNAVLLAEFQFQDTLREGAASEIKKLHHRGLQSHILSGDREAKVANIAVDLEIPRKHWHAGLSPDEKAAFVTKLDQQNTLFVGDGANDSLAFDRAYATATPASDRNLLAAKADCYFISRGLSFLTPLIGLAHRRHRIVRDIFGFTVLYNAAAVALCLTGQMNPLLAAILMPFSSLVTTARVAFGFRGLP